MKKSILLIIVCLLLGLSTGCSNREIKETNETAAAANISAEHVVRDYFKYWNNKDIENLEKVMTSDKEGIVWEFDRLEGNHELFEKVL